MASTLLAAVAVATTPALAEAPKAWTKEDLERMFGPSDPALRPVVENLDSYQVSVEAFLERQYRLLAEEREREMRREEMRSRFEPVEPTYSLGFAPWAGTGWWAPSRPSMRPGGDRPHRPSHRPAAWKANPVGRPISHSARCVNPATAR